MDIIAQLKRHEKEQLKNWINADEKVSRRFAKDIVKFANENPDAIKNYCVNTLPREFSSLSIVYEALSEFSVAFNQFLLDEIKRVIVLAQTKQIKPEYIEVLEDIETEDIYSKDETIYIEIINVITSALHISNEEQLNLQLLNLLDWFLIEYDEDDDIAEVSSWINRMKHIAENATQLEVREEAKDALENLDENLTFNDNAATLESPSFFDKISRFFKL
ncbi:hypothetical protein [Psychroserpens damuponensis]|uniref:hypothetical protein n=1 Tax=Psychroserpens damuponensis TaxID=943936 RepID=UPI00058F0FA1|nr:hypothetical protein [Psychroserpens damuponensis]